MIQNSAFVTMAVRIWRAVEASFLVRAIYAILHKAGDWARGSAVCRFNLRTKSIDDYAKSSFLYRVLQKIWNGVLLFFGRIYRALRRLNMGSINHRLYTRFLMPARLMHAEVFLMAAVLLIFAMPHKIWNNMYALVLAVGLAAVYFICLLGEKKDFGKNVTGLWFSLLVFMFITTASVIGSPAMGDSVRVLVFFWTAFLFSLILYGMMSTTKKLDTMCGVMLAVSAATAVIAVAQRMMGIESDASLTDLALNKGMPGRAFATLGNPNNYAEFLVLFIPFGFAWTLNRKKAWEKCGGLFLVALCVVGLLLTYSRSGWLAFAAAVVVFTALYNRRLLPILILAAFLSIPLLPETILNRILTIGNLADSSSSYRVDIWTGCLAMLRDGYWLPGVGLGPGAFQAVYPAYAVGETGVAPHSHMQFMEILIEMGVLGFISLLWYSWSLVRRTSVHALRTKSRAQKRILCAAAAAVAGITLIGFAEYTWFYPRVQLAFFIAAGMAMASVRTAEKEEGTL